MRGLMQAKQLSPPIHHYSQLVALFEQQFFAAYQTRLVKGQHEPEYLPADQQVPYHRIIFAHGFYASALHEIAHWCIAGTYRRTLPDYGYWYCPDGRNASQQAQFEQVEVKPQALEWAFCLAAGCTFQVSTDNLNGVQSDCKAFTVKVKNQLLNYIEQGFPARAGQFIAALHSYYQTPPLIEWQAQALTDVSA